MQLKPYQKIIKRFIVANKRCAVFCFMGAGKTISTLTAVEDVALIEAVYPVLVLAPLRVAQSTWPNEVRKWPHTRHLRVSPILGDVRQRVEACNRPADIYTTNYENVPWLVAHYGDRWPFKTIVADESTRLKNFRTRQGGIRSKALGTIAFTKVTRFIELTGTPAPNGLLDLWGQLWFVDAGVRLGRTFTSYFQRWFRKAFDGYSSEPFAHSQAEIQDRIKDVCITIDAKDWFDVDDPIVTTIYVDMPPSARILYKEMEKEMFMEIEGHEIEAFNAAAKTQKLLQIGNGAAYLDKKEGDSGARQWKVVHDVKLDALESVVEESNGAPILVAYHFKSDLARLLKRFPKGRALDKAKSTEDEWNAGKIPILFAHPASAGHGLNLQYGGNILVYFSHDWNLEYRMQILERIGPVRQQQAGFDRPVFVYNIIARDSADELVMARVDTKREVQDILLEAMRRRR